MKLGIEGKSALVTGGTHGIGRAIVEVLAKEGCNVAYFSRSEEKLEETRDALRTFGIKQIGLTTDALDRDSLRVFVERMKAEWGGVHILVNNVGGGGRWGTEDMLETEDSVWDEVYEKNTGAAIFLTKACLPFMMRKKFGRVVTVASIFGKEAGGRPWFNIAKASEIALMKNLSQKHIYATNHITFNSVAPGGIYIKDTGWDDEKKKDPQKYQQQLIQKYPMERLGLPEEVADVVAFLCSERASFVNGACVSIDGGESASY